MGMRNLVLLSGPTQSQQDQRLLRLAAWMGVSTKAVAIKGGSSSEELLPGDRQAGPCSLAMSADTLAALHNALTPVTGLLQFIQESYAELLVFDCRGSKEQCSALSRLTDGAVCGIGQTDDPDTLFALPIESAAMSQQLAGLSFSRQNKEPVPVFDLRDATPIPEIIVTANDRPMFVHIDREPLHIYLLAGPSLPDLDEPLYHEFELQEHYDRLIPVLLFLRHCFGKSCWHGPEPTAGLIIDDLLFTDRYGFLDYSVLLKSMQRKNYGTSIAFIPWNYWRTSKRSATRILGGNSNLSVCIHGCDHTNKEFEAEDPAYLARIAGLSMERMEFQRKRTGAGFAQVMVFPQGRFSTAAIPALRANNYLAAVNSTCFPTNSAPDDLTIGDFLRPAITRYNGFPLFQRRYPRRLFDFAFDLFLGKPALVVEHHGFFRNGIEPMEKFVAALYQIQPDLTWPSLDSQLTRSCWMRSLTNSTTEVQFFTRRFQLIHRDAVAGRFLLSKHEPDAMAIQTVLVDGTSIPFSFEKDYLRLEVQADYPGQVLNIDIVDRKPPQKLPSGIGISHNAHVLLRRGLSEFRDNTLARHSRLLKFANRIAKQLKVTGDS
jgi:hypothetical protein